MRGCYITNHWDFLCHLHCHCSRNEPMHSWRNRTKEWRKYQIPWLDNAMAKKKTPSISLSNNDIKKTLFPFNQKKNLYAYCIVANAIQCNSHPPIEKFSISSNLDFHSFSIYMHDLRFSFFFSPFSLYFYEIQVYHRVSYTDVTHSFSWLADWLHYYWHLQNFFGSLNANIRFESGSLFW